MRQELIDLLLGELPPGEERSLRERIAVDPALAKELEDLKALFGLMRRAETVEPSAAMRRRVLRAAGPRPLARALDALRSFPGLLVYRFQHSPRFRILFAAAAAHVLLGAIVLNAVERPAAPQEPSHEFTFLADERAPILPPSRELLARLGGRGLSHETVLRRVGVPGQREAIRAGLERLLASQRADGSFGSLAETGYGALALLAEGHLSRGASRESAALAGALRHIRERGRLGETHGAAVSALVEDYALCRAARPEEECFDEVETIVRMVPGLGDDEDAREALALVAWARVPAKHPSLAEASRPLGSERAALLSGPPTRLAATRLLAKGGSDASSEAVRTFVRPLFEEAMRDLEANRDSARAILTLQSPYRL